MGKRNRHNGQKLRRWKERQFRDTREIRCCFCPTMLTIETATIEHIIPWSQCTKRQRDRDDNLTLACNRCNGLRGRTDFLVFLRLMASTLATPSSLDPGLRVKLALKPPKPPRPPWRKDIDHRAGTVDPPSG